MLVLTRKAEESIVIGDEIQITVIAVNNNRVKIGIEAPRRVRVVRSEILPAYGHDFPAVTGELLEEADRCPAEPQFQAVLPR